MLKVAKFGGSSVAGAGQFQKVKEIVEADPSRRIVVSSAAGTLLCCLPHRFFSDSRLVFGGHLWLCLYAAAVLVIMLVIMGPSPDYGAFLIFCCWFILPPVLLGTAVSCRLYLRSRPDSKESEPEPEWKKYVSRR